jgi:chromosome segregation ATPase
MDGETKDDVAVREAWRAYDAACELASKALSALPALSERDQVEAAIEARTKARLARAVPPLTLMAEREAEMRATTVPDAFGDWDPNAFDLFAELDALRAALAASREESADLRAQLAAVTARHDKMEEAAHNLATQRDSLRAKIEALQAAVESACNTYGEPPAAWTALRAAWESSRV